MKKNQCHIQAFTTVVPETGGSGPFVDYGITMLDYYAAASLQGIRSDPSRDLDLKQAASLTYDDARAMMAEREL